MSIEHTHRTTTLLGRTIAVAAIIVAGLSMSTAVDAAPTTAASVTRAASADTDLPARLERACLRIPNLRIRTDNLLERIHGDASTRGSLLWLEAQIERARNAGRDQLVTVLENRLEVRRATVDVLGMRRDLLVDLADRCRELGVDL